MSYRDFSYLGALHGFALQETTCDLFPDLTPLPPSDWLRESLRRMVKYGRPVPSEKAKSEFIVAPILAEVGHRNAPHLTIHSGIRLDVAPEQGLNGECDFILAGGATAYALQAPILAMVEAKRSEVEQGMGQCVAQMFGARLYNEKDGLPAEAMYGCVTTGETWQFLKLNGNTLIIDSQRYYLDTIERLLAVLQSIVGQVDN